jgi:hypothetical protein
MKKYTRKTVIKHELEDALLEHIRQSPDFKALVQRLEADNRPPDSVNVNFLMKPVRQEKNIEHIKGVGFTTVPQEAKESKWTGKPINKTPIKLKEESIAYDNEPTKRRKAFTRDTE